MSGAAAKWAVVDVDGSLVRGKGVVSSAMLVVPGNNRYQVIFDQDVSNCAYTATLGPYYSEFSSAGFIGVGRDVGNANGVVLETWNIRGDADARSFHLVVNV